MRLAPVACVGFLLAGFGWPAAASADLVYLQGGRTLSVKSHRVEGDRVVLVLRAGGEIVCDAALIERVAPDEVPYPEPEVETETSLPTEIVPAAASAVPFDDLIGPLAQQHGVDPTLVRAVVEAESNFRPAARSRKGAMGLMQLMPATARQYQVDDPYDPRANLDAGIRHLRSLLDRYDVSLALAAYNAGEGTVLRYGGVPPFRETRQYVSRILDRLRAGSASSPARRPAASR